MDATHEGTQDHVDLAAAIEADHRAVAAMLEEVMRPEVDREAIRDRIVRALSQHGVAEEEVVYPEVRRIVDGGDDLIDESVAEHQALKEALADLDHADAGSRDWDDALARVVATVEHHVPEEEQEVLPALRAAASRERWAELGQAFETAKRTAPTRPHPHAPNTPPGNVIAGAAASVIDHARDAITGRGKDD